MRIFYLLVLWMSLIHAGENAVTHTIEDDHLGWGWQAHVVRNELITLAVIPAIGGRAMQYDLQNHPFLWVNNKELGRTYEPAEDAPWHNFGGYKSWIAPQGNWRRGMGNWPPAPTLDAGVYKIEVSNGEDGTVTLQTVSPRETFPAWQAKDLAISRQFTIYPGSTRIRVEQQITNHGTTSQVVSNWDVTQVPGTHSEANDPDSFWVYFPINARSMFGARGYFTFPASPQTMSESQFHTYGADGVSAVQYLQRTGKIGADVVNGWIAAVDERDGYTFVKRFTQEKLPDPGNYPDGGSTVQVFTSGNEPYMEVSVLGPLIDLTPQQTTSLVIDWYATRIDGPIMKATDAGVCKRRLSLAVNDNLARIRGLFGIFQNGTIELIAIPGPQAKQQKHTSLGSYYATPLEAMTLDVEMKLPAGTAFVSALVRTAMGKEIGELDRVAVPNNK